MRKNKLRTWSWSHLTHPAMPVATKKRRSMITGIILKWTFCIRELLLEKERCSRKELEETRRLWLWLIVISLRLAVSTIRKFYSKLNKINLINNTHSSNHSHLSKITGYPKRFNNWAITSFQWSSSVGMLYIKKGKIVQKFIWFDRVSSKSPKISE